MCSSAGMRSVCTKEAGLRTVAELDEEVSRFFPGRNISVVDRAWVAEHPARLHFASRRRWRRLANAPAREPVACAQARLAALATRTHRLSQAIVSGDLMRLKNLFALGLDLTAQLHGYGFASRGETALHSACAAKQPALVAWMLHRGADPTARDGSGRSAADVVDNLATCDLSLSLQALLNPHVANLGSDTLSKSLVRKRVQAKEPSTVAHAVSRALAFTKTNSNSTTRIAAAAAPCLTPRVSRGSQNNSRTNRSRGPSSILTEASAERWHEVALQRTKRQVRQQHFARETFMAPFGR